MYQMNIFRIFFCFVFLIASYTGISQTVYLEKPVTLHFNDEPVLTIFRSISKQTGVVFSYTQFDDHQKITVNYSKKPLKFVLTEILQTTNSSYKIKGKYVIITSKKPESTSSEQIRVEGFIYDSKDSTGIHNVSIYSKQNRHSTISDDKGFFSFSFPKSNYPTYLSIAKENYRDTFIVIQPIASKQVVKVHLHSKKKKIDPIYLPEKESIIKGGALSDTLMPLAVAEKPTFWDNVKKKGKELENFSDSSLVKFKTSKFWKRIETTNPNFTNVTDTFFSRVSVSLFPLISTNKLLSINTVNHLSFNILAGYSKGVDGIELGSFLNIDNGDVKYLQLSGFSNIVTGNVTGFQGAGFANIVAQSMTGIQSAGFSNYIGGTFSGVQLSGFSNFTRSYTYGVQLAGSLNIVADEFNGIQGAGLLNITRKQTKGMQLAGVINLSGSVNGIQIAGVTNYSHRKLEGMQLAGIINRADTVDGFQLSGLVNSANHCKGNQLGILNFSRSTTGIPIGFFSYVRSGYHKIEIAQDEQNFTQLAFRTGVDKFHNIFTFGTNFARNNDYLQFGYGLGTSLQIKKKIYLDFDVVTTTFQKENATWDLNSLNKLFIGIEYRLAKKLSVAIGPTLNVWVASNTSPEMNVLSDSFSKWDFYSKTQGDNEVKAWVGGKISLKFL